MQKGNLDFVLEQAKGDLSGTPIGQAIAASVEVGTVFPSKLRAELADAGYVVKDDEAAMSDYGFSSSKVLKRVLVVDSTGDIVAMGAAADADEAILASMLGWCRENALPTADIPEGIASAPIV